MTGFFSPLTHLLQHYFPGFQAWSHIQLTKETQKECDPVFFIIIFCCFSLSFTSSSLSSNFNVFSFSRYSILECLPILPIFLSLSPRFLSGFTSNFEGWERESVDWRAVQSNGSVICVHTLLISPALYPYSLEMCVKRGREMFSLFPLSTSWDSSSGLKDGDTGRWKVLPILYIFLPLFLAL